MPKGPKSESEENPYTVVNVNESGRSASGARILFTVCGCLLCLRTLTWGIDSLMDQSGIYRDPDIASFLCSGFAGASQIVLHLTDWRCRKELALALLGAGILCLLLFPVIAVLL